MTLKSQLDTYMFCFVLFLLQTTRLFFEVTGEFIFILSNLLFSGFIVVKLFTLRREKRLLLNPVFLASIKMFLLAYGFSIVYIYLENKSLHEYFDVRNPFVFLNNSMIYASLGFIAMWYSFHNRTIKIWAISIYHYLARKRSFIRQAYKPNWFLIYTFFAASIVGKLILISLGAYGVLSTIFADEIDIPYMRYLSLLSSLGSGALLFVYLEYFKNKRKKNVAILFFCINLFFSLIAGFKGAIVSCFIVPAVAYYIVNAKFKMYHFIIIALAVVFAYKVVTPFRYYMQTNPNFQRNSIHSIVTGLIDSFEEAKAGNDDGDSFAMIKRFNFLPELTKFQEYKTVHGLTEDDPEFLNHIITVPLQIFIPRFIWPDYPKSDLGRIWVTQKVFGRNYKSITVFWVLGFLYLAGGSFAIIAGFILIGFFLQIVNVFFKSGSWGGIIVALILFQPTTSLEAQYNFYIIAFVQTFIMAIIFQGIILKKSKI